MPAQLRATDPVGYFAQLDPAKSSSRTTATRWRLRIYAVPLQFIQRIDITTTAAGVEALPEADRGLEVLGWTRDGGWTLGTVRTYTATVHRTARASADL